MSVMAPEAHDPCQSCPRRLDTQDSRRGWCETCTRWLRVCPACGEPKPQTGWDWGLVRFSNPLFALRKWVCPACKLRQPGELAARFACRLPLDDVARRLLGHELDVSAERMRDAPRVGPVMVALACQVGQGPDLDVDVSELDAYDRRMVLYCLRVVANRLPAPAYGEQAEQLTRRWSGVCEDLPELPATSRRLPTPAEDATRMGWERAADAADA